MNTAVAEPLATRAVAIIDMTPREWERTGQPGLWLKPVRRDDTRGLYLGLVRFDAFTASGLHQHQGVASSFVVDGGLTDYHGSLGLHEAGINRKGSTHDAISYQATTLVSRLEGPVTYPPDSAYSGVHAGSYYGNFRNPDPNEPPEINVPVDALARHPTGHSGVTRQDIFDYAGTGSDHRMVQLSLRPESAFTLRTGALTEMWVRGGLLSVNGDTARANCFITCPAGTEIRIESPYGALLIVWAEGREAGADSNLFGY